MGYRRHIREEFERRKKKNDRYSLRAFARDLGMGVSVLSSCLSGKRNLSPMNLRKIQKVLGWTDEIHKRALHEIEPQTKPIRGKKTRDLPTDLIAGIATWQSLAILNLARMPNNRSSPEWIAKRLNITTEEARAAIENLISMNLIAVKGRSLVQLHKERIRFANELPKSALQNIQKQLSECATRSLTEVEWPHRHFLASLFNGDRKDLENSVPKIHRFASTMKSSLSKADGDDVLAVVVHVFPLTRS